MKITTNHHHRPVIYAYDLSAKEREQFDWLDWEAIDDGRDNATFVRYRGELYPLSDFGVTTGTSLPAEMNGWDGYLTDSYFSGLVIKFVGDSEVVVGSFITD